VQPDPAHVDEDVVERVDAPLERPPVESIAPPFDERPEERDGNARLGSPVRRRVDEPGAGQPSGEIVELLLWNAHLERGHGHRA